ncbi:DUF3152 domain-containing protein [Corynebacterium mendelii]|uniref:DUF3152 domain-containing protein n=1 Tax=Corynebacterium mendelii TaxID=2765362 RepID=A0A939IU18_9CORY|nr:DUF3152 domain-containing protein [Corynebacterium mendelii]MBN9644449.1 DUF3152 domain-containing protein [Corynebacterium mendelii]
MLVRFARNYGWRAYAIPVLVVITVWVLVDVCRGGLFTGDDGAAPAPATSPAAVATTAAADGDGRGEQTTTRGRGPDPATHTPAIDDESGQLPPGGPFVKQGTGLYHLAGRAGEQFGQGTEKVFTYTVEVEEGIPASHYGGDGAFAALVDATLSDPRGWTQDPRFGFRHIDGTSTEQPDLRIQLTSVGSTHDACGHDIGMETSCFTTIGNRVVINESRWVRGAIPFNGDIGSYRRYLINHEVGHAIGYAAHEPCGADGALAPVMMQQTLSLSNSFLHNLEPSEVYPDDGAVCRYNPWPFPAPQPPAPEPPAAEVPPAPDQPPAAEVPPAPDQPPAAEVPPEPAP